jgi:hypothetical protein
MTVYGWKWVLERRYLRSDTEEMHTVNVCYTSVGAGQPALAHKFNNRKEKQ